MWRREIHALGISMALTRSKRSAGIMQQTPESAEPAGGRAEWTYFPSRAREAAGWPVPRALIHEEPEYYQWPVHTPTSAKPWIDWLLIGHP